MQLKVYRRDNRRTEGRRRWLSALRAAGWAGLAAAAVAAYLWREPLIVTAVALRDFVLQSPYFAVREIQVRGGAKVSGDEIIAMAGLRQGMSIWQVDLVGIEKKIARYPWVRRVLARRDFPRRIIIEVEERKPKAIVAVRKLYYVDGDGVVFKEVAAGDNVKFPLLTGLHAEELMAAGPALRQRLRDAIRLAEMMAPGSHSLSEIHFEAPDRLVVYTTAYPLALHMGWGEWDVKLERLERLLELWKGHEERLASLDLNFRDQVVARLKRAQP